MAEERANTIQSTTYKSVIHSNSYDFVAKKKPISANGIANIVWLNFINDKYFFIRNIYQMRLLNLLLLTNSHQISQDLTKKILLDDHLF